MVFLLGITLLWPCGKKEAVAAEEEEEEELEGTF